MKKEIIKFDGIGPVVVTTNKRAKNIKLSISTGEVRITRPAFVSTASVSAFIEKNREWICKKLAASKQGRQIHDGDVLAPNTKVAIAQSKTASKVEVAKTEAGILVRYPVNLSSSDEEVQSAIVETLVPIWRKRAKNYLPKRINQLATTYGFEFGQLRLKNIHSRWGSCSSAGNINLNIQLMKLDEDLIDHVLLHELSHTKAMSHGSDFWKVFESVRPGARAERKQLKQMVIF